MRGIKNRYFEGERILYGLNDANLEGITFGEGESPLKEATNITLKNSIFKWKYPLWYDENVNVENTTFETMSRSGIWYTKNISILNNGRHVLSGDLQFDGEKYAVDWQDLEQKLAEPLTTLMIFCNPHNPVGKVWTAEEVQRIADLCHKHHVTLLSDEIHGDLVRKGPDYTPAFSVEVPAKQSVISLVSPSKTFNVAALHAATAIVPDENLREMVSRGLNSDEVAEPNLLAIPATIAAYEQGHDWLKGLKAQLNDNFDYAAEFIQAKIPTAKVISGTATYLMWIDVHEITDNSEKLVNFIREETGLIVSAGSIYRGDGHDFIRINLACPLEMVKDGMDRLATGISKYSKWLYM